MSRLGIVVALSGELRSLTSRRLTPGTVTTLAGNLLVIQSGMGAANAQAAGLLLLQHGATRLLSWGSAAALVSPLGAGSLILPEIILAADGRQFAVDSDWHARVQDRLHSHYTAYTQALVESPAVVSTAADKRALADQSGAIAVDMESAALAALAQQAKLPFLVIRAIADTAQVAVPARLVAAMTGHARFQQLRLLRAVLLHPGDWPAIAKLAQGFGAAQKTLAGVARHSLD